ncbi:nuclear receptor ROR-alpha A-like [Saccostrea cucullata]|uniref:nuclear receptor ROR-alpha A-like n=1 Tax=Saccostrea cuccullata TaxID=36930 RepID=UPI002ED0782D
MSGNVEEQIAKDPDTKEKPQEGKKKRKSGSKEQLTFPPCKVCSGKATGLHYGVYTCEPCKAFFRRAITDKNKYACLKDSNCEITAEKRGNCSACRLQKCFNLGMSKSAVRQGRYTIELRTNTILEVKRLANQTAVEVSVDNQQDNQKDNQKDNPDGQTSSDFARVGGASSACDSDGNQTTASEDQSDFVPEESDTVEPSVDLSLLPCQSGCGQESSDSNLPPKKKVRLRDTVNPLESCDCVVTPGSQSLTRVSCDMAIGADTVTLSADTVTLSERQIQCLIQTLVKAHDTIYPNFKNYFEKEHQKFLEDKFIANQKIQEDVFGIKSLLDKDEFEKVYRATGIDVDGRLELLKKMYSHRERSLMKYFTFAKCIQGFTDLSMNDKISLVKYGEHEYWILGHFTHYHPELKASIGNEIQMTFENHGKLFGQSLSDEMLKMFNTLLNMNFMYQEVVLLRGIVLFSRDRSALEDADLVESVQWRLIQCLKYLVELFHPDEPRKFSQCLQILVDLRDLSELRQKSQKKQLDDYTLNIIKEYPLIYEALGESMSKLKTQ